MSLRRRECVYNKERTSSRSDISSRASQDPEGLLVWFDSVFFVEGKRSGVSGGYSIKCSDLHSADRLVRIDKRRTCLGYHIYERLCILHREAEDLILIRDNYLDQGTKFMRGKRTSDQASAGWSIAFEKRESNSD